MNPQRTNRPESVYKYIGFSFLILLGTIVLFWRKLFLQGMIPFDGDTLGVVYINWAIGGQLLKKGLFILWDPFRNLGMPFMASPPNQALYPLRLIFIGLNFLDYQRVFVLFHQTLSAAFTYLLLRKWKHSVWASLVGVIGISFNGFVLARVTANIDFATMAWLPALIYFLELEQPILLGIVICFQWLAGFPTFFILSGLFLFLICLTHQEKASFLKTWFFGYYIGVGLSAVTFIPFLEMMKLSARPVFLNSQVATLYSLSWKELIYPLSYPSFIINKLEPLSNSDTGITGFYVGPIIFILFLIGIFVGKRSEKILGLSGLFFLALTLGNRFPLYAYVPFIQIFRFPPHWIFLSIPCLVFIAVKTLDQVKSNKIKILILIFISIDFLIYSWPAKKRYGDLDFITHSAEALSVYKTSPRWGRIFHKRDVMDLNGQWNISSQDEWKNLIQLMYPSISVGAGFLEGRSRHQLTSQRHINFQYQLDTATLDSPLFDFAGIQTIVGLKNSLPADQVPRFSDLSITENDDHREHSFSLENKPVDILRDEPGFIYLHASGPSSIVYSETAYPGWIAYVDGKKLKPEIFQNIFPMIKISDGSHDIIFKYRPLSVIIGLIVTGSTLLMLLFLWIKKHL